MAVIFDEEEDDEDEEHHRRRDGDADMAGEVQEEDEEGGDGLDTRMERELHAGVSEEVGDGAAQEEELPVSAIDAYWLQRECAKYYSDPLIAQRTAEEVGTSLGLGYGWVRLGWCVREVWEALRGPGDCTAGEGGAVESRTPRWDGGGEVGLSSL